MPTDYNTLYQYFPVQPSPRLHRYRRKAQTEKAYVEYFITDELLQSSAFCEEVASQEESAVMASLFRSISSRVKFGDTVLIRVGRPEASEVRWGQPSRFLVRAELTPLEETS